MNDYWIKFWEESGKKTVGKGLQSQVLRTINKVPIEESEWKKILDFVLSKLELNDEDDVLDLFGGNGLFAKEIAQSCNSVTVVDASKDLLDNIDTEMYPNINKIASDVRTLSIPEKSYSKVLVYAGIQYLTEEEVIGFLKFIYDSLKDGGICYIGDIPDENRKWNFYNSSERESVYFENLTKGQPIIGTWFDNVWFEKLAKHIGFSSAVTVQQHPEFPFSYFRYDLIINK